MITFEIPGKPIPWKAPYVGKKGAFSPHSVRQSECRWILKAQFNHDPWELPLKVSLKFFFNPPKRASKVKRQKMLDGEILFERRPDISNLEKFALDCGNGILWKDDAQIIHLVAEKAYGTREGTMITMEPYSDWEE